jgi:hypothetical protein
MFHCPGCQSAHSIRTSGTVHPLWKVTGTKEDKPTVTPSIHCKSESRKGTQYICHSFVREGKIQFLNDCTHELAGQTVELPDFDE